MALEEDKVRKQDTTKTIVFIAGSAAGRVLAWRFIKQNWAEFDNRWVNDKQGDGRKGIRTSIQIYFKDDFILSLIKVWKLYRTYLLLFGVQ